jgi:cyclic pyranopterin phosphate synthase
LGTFTHLDREGRARMVDIGNKEPTLRIATAGAEVILSAPTMKAVLDGAVPKGDVFSVARVAGILAGKKTPDLIPLTHPIPIDSLNVDVSADEGIPGIRIEATAASTGKTGVEMEALTAVSVAALTVYDMLKSLEKDARITNVRLIRKSGGKSGEWKEGQESGGRSQKSEEDR